MKLSLGPVSAHLEVPRLAPAERRSSDWADKNTREAQRQAVLELSSEDRQLVARGWLALALRLHRDLLDASRLTLELMAAGAPSELLDRSEACCLELTNSASAAFAVASAYAETALTPGGLEVPEPLCVEPAALVARLFYEGFLGGEIALRVHDAWRKAEPRPEIAAALEPVYNAARNQLELARAGLLWLLRGPASGAIPRLLEAAPLEISWDGLPALSAAQAGPQLWQRGLLSLEQLEALRRDAIERVLPSLHSELTKQVTH